MSKKEKVEGEVKQVESVFVGFRLPTLQALELSEAAKHDHRSRNGLLRFLIDQYLESRPKPEPGTSYEFK